MLGQVTSVEMKGLVLALTTELKPRSLGMVFIFSISGMGLPNE